MDPAGQEAGHRHTAAAIKFGSEREALFRNITIENCVISRSNRGISLQLRDPGSIENVIFSNLALYEDKYYIRVGNEGDPCKRLIIQFCLPKTVSGLSNECEQLLNLFHQPVPIFRFDAELRQKIYRKQNQLQ